MLPNSIQLTSYIISYNLTNAFNQQLNDSIVISSKHHHYVLNTTCSYETGVTLCPASHYCFTLRGVYNKDRTIIETSPTNKICFTTPKYRKLVNFDSRVFINLLHSSICVIHEYQVQYNRGYQIKHNSDYFKSIYY